MASITIPWATGGGGITLSYTGEGDGTVTVSSTANEGKDRAYEVTVSAGGGITARSVTVTQTGLRENMMVSEGVFSSSDGEFLVLK